VISFSLHVLWKRFRWFHDCPGNADRFFRCGSVWPAALTFGRLFAKAGGSFSDEGIFLSKRTAPKKG